MQVCTFSVSGLKLSRQAFDENEQNDYDLWKAKQTCQLMHFTGKNVLTYKCSCSCLSEVSEKETSVCLFDV